MTKRSYTLRAEAPNAVDDLRQMLDDLPVDMDEVNVIEVHVEADDSRLGGVQQTLDEVTLSAEMAEGDVEYGPVPESERSRRPGTGSKKGGGMYHGRTYQDAVMPDTQRAKILRAVSGRWATSLEIAELVDIEQNKVSAYLSADFNDYGYVKRRGDTPPYEYALDQDGRSALDHGEKMYKERQEAI